jgi:lysyl-tRNA synthetase class 1
METDAARRIGAFLYVRGLVNEDLPQPDIIARAARLIDCLSKLVGDLEMVNEDDQEEAIQAVFYEAGKLHFQTELRWWFAALYQILLGQPDGPRLGQFTKIMTVSWVTDRIVDTIDNPWKTGLILT